jgi:hypothetical protein
MSGKQIEKSEVIQRVTENEALIALGAKQNFESILNISMGLKGMKDLGEEVGWKALGYENFEDYTTRRWNLAQRQAYSYILVADRLPKGFLHSLQKTSKASLGRLLALLPNDQNEFKLTPEQVEDLMLLPPEDFKKQLVKLTGYDRKRDGGRGPSDLDRPNVSRDRYRDQQGKILTLKEKLFTVEEEKDELVDQLEKLEATVSDLKKVTSPDKDKNELIGENKQLVLRVAEMEKLLFAHQRLTLKGQFGIDHVMTAITDCAAIFSKIGSIELSTHEQWVEFRAYTDTIRRLLEDCEERVAATMAEKGLQPKDYEEWHEGSFRYHMDKATERMRQDYADKTAAETDALFERMKAERKAKREAEKKKAVEK